MKESAIAEPPLSGLFGMEIMNFLIFTRVLLTRLFFYASWLVHQFVYPIQLAEAAFCRFKKFMTRLLMYKGGYFYQTPRLGLAAVLSTTAFSLAAFPIMDPIGDAQSLSIILAEGNSNIEQQSLTLIDGIGSAEKSGRDLRTEVESYTVEAGDTISTIAESYLVSAEALLYVNEMDYTDLLHPGDTLTIPPVEGLVHTVGADQTISEIADVYSVSPQAIVDFNYLEEPFVIHEGDELIVPDAKVPQKKSVVEYAVAPANAGTPGLVLQTIDAPQQGTGGFSMPTAGTITQYFWWGHTAIDIAGSCGTPIVAADSGTITFAGWWAGGGGNSVFVDHGNGYVTQYAHMSGFAKTAGGVERGEVIGYMGATGRAYGCHLHFIVNQGGRVINPLSVL